MALVRFVSLRDFDNVEEYGAGMACEVGPGEAILGRPIWRYRGGFLRGRVPEKTFIYL